MEKHVRRYADQFLSNVRVTDGTIRAQCPFCGHRRAYLMSLDHGGWTCFACSRSGSILAFLRAMGFSREDVDAARELLKLDRMAPIISRRLRAREAVKRAEESVLPDFILGAYDRTPQALIDAGFTEEILAEHDVGYDVRTQRITFPIRDEYGRLVAISGRADRPWIEPRYKVYSARPPTSSKPAGELYDVIDHDYTVRNKDYLYGFDTVMPARDLGPQTSNEPLIVVEGYKGCLWMRQQGFAQTVALQSTNLSSGQLRQLSRVRGPYYIMLDWEPGKQYPDSSGHCAALKLVQQLSPFGQVLLVMYPGYQDQDPHAEKPIGTSPDDLTGEEIEQSVLQAKSAAQLEIGLRPRRWRREL